MTPYFADRGITIYHGDARELVAQMPEVDLLLTDPPYGVAYSSGRRDTMGEFGVMQGDSGDLDVVAVLASAISRLRNGRHVYVFGPFDLSPLPLGGRTPLIWDKEIIGMGNTALPWGVSHEPLTFGVKVASAKNRRDGYGNGAARLRQGSVLRFQRTHSIQNLRHPTEKPVPLLRELIESSSHLGECVLDPFMGSGSTLVAALVEGRRAIGIEIEERYCALAADRLQRITLPNIA